MPKQDVELDGHEQTEKLEMLVQWFDEFANLKRDERDEAALARDYYDNKQFTEQELSDLRARGQPPVVDNKYKDKVLFLIGLEKQTRTEPRAYPRTPEDEDAGEAATDALRYIADASHYDDQYSAASQDLMIEGIGVVAVEVRGKGKNKIIRIKRIPYDRFWYDPYSKELDFSDADYRGQAIWMDVDEAKRKWPKAAESFDVVMDDGRRDLGMDYEQRPMAQWSDPVRKKVRILECYYKEAGEIQKAMFSHSAILEGPMPSPYRADVDGEEQLSDPYVARSLYIDSDGIRYSLFRRWKDIQDELNKRRSKMLHLLTVNQTIRDEGAVEDPHAMRRAVNRPDGDIEVRPGARFEVRSNETLAQGQFLMLQATVEAFGQTDPNQGLEGSGARSGRAKQIDQQSGIIPLSDLFDTLRSGKRETFEKTWHRVQQFWTAERWIRVTDDEDNIKFVVLNRLLSPEEAKQRAVEKLGDERAALLDIPTEPVMENGVATMHVDISIGEAPDVVNLQAEQFSELVDLARAGIQIPPEALIEASAIRNKERILELMKGGGEMTPEQQQQAQAVKQLQGEMIKLQIAQQQSEIAKNAAEAQSKAADAEKKAAEAERQEIENVGLAASLGVVPT